MGQRLKSVYRGLMNDECENMANDGLRTLGNFHLKIKYSICLKVTEPKWILNLERNLCWGYA